MDVKVETGALSKLSAPALVLGHCEGDSPSALLKQLDARFRGKIKAAFGADRFSGKFLTTAWVQTYHKAIPHILLVGLGPARQITLYNLRQGIGAAVTAFQKAGQTDISIYLNGIRPARASAYDVAQAVVEGAILTLYRFDSYKTDRKALPKEVKTLRLIVAPDVQMENAARGALHGQWIAESVNATRTLCNLPANVLTPSRLAEEALHAAEQDPLIHVLILERADVQQLGMGGYAGVAQGTTENPKFIVLEYRGSRGRPVALVGKSVTFDSGGISLKPAENMDQMRYDMSGGAAVLGVMRVAAKMKWPLHIVGVLPATDNMPSGHAIHPGDIVKMLSGKTVEVANTDAEGRLCLADAMTYALRYKPHTVIDLATLTGACSVALGNHAIALFGNDPRLVENLERASEETGERVWPMPLWDDYFDQIKSDVADLRNIGGRPGGAITAALFLKQFATGVAWAHLDIAGTAWNGESARPLFPKGSTGVGVRLLVRYLINSLKP